MSVWDFGLTPGQPAAPGEFIREDIARATSRRAALPGVDDFAHAPNQRPEQKRLLDDVVSTALDGLDRYREVGHT